MPTRAAVRTALCATALLAPLGSAGEPTVVELFTSQGCSSCPPADAALAQLAGRDDVLALSFHVDYWDRLGWKDPFSSRAWTRRQHDYADRMGSDRVYTPQMVIDGTIDALGSRPASVAAGLERAAAGPEKLVIGAEHSDTGWVLDIPAAAAPLEGVALLVGYRAAERTAVPRGENTGRTLHHVNVVDALTELSDWDGAALSLAVPAASVTSDHAAVLLQDLATGRIVGVERLR